MSAFIAALPRDISHNTKSDINSALAQSVRRTAIMAPSRELADLFADDDKEDLETGEIGDIKPQSHSQALIDRKSVV